MKPNEEKRFSLYSKLNKHKALILKTAEFIQSALNQVRKPYVACSFGKDSSVMLHLILQYAPKITVRFARHPETELLGNYSAIIGWWRDNFSINLEEIYCEGGLLKVKHHQRNMLNEGEWDSFFVGIRAEESQARMFSLRKFGRFHRLKSGKMKISPLAWWKEDDIGAYTLVHRLPLLERYELEGVSSRTSSGIPRTHITETLQALKERDIGRFNQLCTLFDDAKHFV